ncbi:MAG: AtpZ/AtpI family protein [Cyclobacteriaceae bacterium]|nr:AtpZ/AtpI family protein [Cyclobacteriaceae bacterium]
MQDHKSKKNLKQFNDYAKYSGIAFSFAAILSLSAWLGITLDEKITSIEFPILSVLLPLTSIVGAMISLIIRLTNEGKNEK